MLKPMRFRAGRRFNRNFERNLRWNINRWNIDRRNINGRNIDWRNFDRRNIERNIDWNINRWNIDRRDIRRNDWRRHIPENVYVEHRNPRRLFGPWHTDYPFTNNCCCRHYYFGFASDNSRHQRFKPDLYQGHLLLYGFICYCFSWGHLRESQPLYNCGTALIFVS